MRGKREGRERKEGGKREERERKEREQQIINKIEIDKQLFVK